MYETKGGEGVKFQIALQYSKRRAVFALTSRVSKWSIVIGCENNQNVNTKKCTHTRFLRFL